MAIHTSTSPDAQDLSVVPRFTRSGMVEVPKQPDPRPGDAAPDGVPDRPGRGDARRQRPLQPRHLRHDVDGRGGRPALRRDVRQEHGRQGRVPADRRDRGPLRGHARRPLARAGRRRQHRYVDHRQLRGLHARRPRAQAQVAERAARGGAADGPAQHRDGRQRPGGLGEVRQLLGGGAALHPPGGRRLPPDARPAARARRREHHRRRGRARVHHGRHLRAGGQDICAKLDDYEQASGIVGAGARGRRVRRVHRAVHPARPGLGLPAPQGRLDPVVRAQVRARLPRGGLGAVAGRRAPARATWSSTSTTWAATCPPSR